MYVTIAAAINKHNINISSNHSSSSYNIDFCQAVTVWTHIQEVLSSNLGQTPAILTESFPQSLLANSRSVCQLRHDCFPPNTFQFIIHLPPYQLIVYSYSLATVMKDSQRGRGGGNLYEQFFSVPQIWIM
jgi:hypothetical protein